MKLRNKVGLLLLLCCATASFCTACARSSTSEDASDGQTVIIVEPTQPEVEPEPHQADPLPEEDAAQPIQPEQELEQEPPQEEPVQEESSQAPQQDEDTNLSPENTPPEPENDDPLSLEIQYYLDTMTLEEKVAQLFVVTPDALVHGSSVTQAEDVTREAIEQIPVGGLIYMGNNLVSFEQAQTMLEHTKQYSLERIGLVPFLSVDEEGGSVARISGRDGFDIAPISDMADIGSTADTGQAREIGRQIGGYLSQLGFNLDFAPVADVWSNPENAIVRKRSFGTDPMLVAEMSQAVYEGLEEADVFGCYKHFPGHGATEGDSHLGYAFTSKSLDELMACELIPFQAAIDSGAQFIMVGHISLPNVLDQDTPASLSEVAVTQILRQQMGYNGIIITDALNMKAVSQQYTSEKAAVKALQAGVDLLLMPEDFDAAYTGVLQAVSDGTISEDRIDASLTRILTVKLQMDQG